MAATVYHANFLVGAARYNPFVIPSSRFLLMRSRIPSAGETAAREVVSVAIGVWEKGGMGEILQGRSLIYAGWLWKKNVWVQSTPPSCQPSPMPVTANSPSSLTIEEICKAVKGALSIPRHQ